jgi:hypothetical protein
MDAKGPFKPLVVTSLVEPEDYSAQHGRPEALAHASGQVFDLDYSAMPPPELEALRFVLSDLGWEGYLGFVEDGMDSLHDGTAQLSDETADMPDTIQSEIDDLLDSYTGSDFTPISFTSPKNEHTDLVQFVLKCDGIELPEEPKTAQVETARETFWDRLTALFTGKKDD